MSNAITKQEEQAILNQGVTQVFPQKNPHSYCDAFNCRNRARWFIGRPGDGLALRLCYKVCDDCLKTIARSIPHELVSSEAAGEQQKQYRCKYCNEPADSPQKLATHTRLCPMNPKNGG